MSAGASAECDFVRFLGRKSLDDDGDDKHHLISGSQGDLQLPPEASLLVASNRLGALIAGTAQGLRWAWLADLSRECAPRGVRAAFTSVDLAGAPVAFALSTDEAQLACVTTTSGGAAMRLQLFDVAALLRGRCLSPHLGALQSLHAQISDPVRHGRHEPTSHDLKPMGSLLELQVHESPPPIHSTEPPTTVCAYR